LAYNLGRVGVKVDALYSIDSVRRPIQGPAFNPGNIRYLANYRINDVQISGAEDYVLDSSVDHMNIPGHPAILADVEGQILGSVVRTTNKAPTKKKPVQRQAFRVGIDIAPPATATR
jgi:hypothetical protein